MGRGTKILLVTWDGAGNLPPARSLARALMARGHTVHALAHESVREVLAADGVESRAVRGVRPYDSQQSMPPDEEMPFVLEHIWFARPFGAELLASVDRLRPDVLLIDICLAHALLAAQRAGIPTAALCHFPYQLMVGPFAPLLDARLQEINSYAGELGVGPFSSHQALVEAASLILVSSYRSFDSTAAFAPNVVHVGPLRPRGDGIGIWHRRLPAAPLVLVSLSTSQQNQSPLLQRLCDALAGLPVEAIVTTGPAIDPASLRTSDNTTALGFLSHDDILPLADLLITHAGHGTVMAGATHGVPMLCLPMGRDQPLIAARVAQLGMGSVIGADAPVAAIRQQIAELLADAGARRRAREFAISLGGHADLHEAVRLVEGLVPTG